MSVLAYIRHMARLEWITSFFYVKTALLIIPPHFRDVPRITGKECTHCFQCMMICPAPGAIEVVVTEKPSTWNPVIYPGHCIRCGLCVEICPELVLDSGRVHKRSAHDGTYMQFTFHITVNPVACMGCGICTVVCPVNKEIDPQLAAKGTSSSDEVIMRVHRGKNTVFHEEKCTGCKTCEEQCPNRSVLVARVLEPLQVRDDS